MHLKQHYAGKPFSPSALLRCLLEALPTSPALSTLPRLTTSVLPAPHARTPLQEILEGKHLGADHAAVHKSVETYYGETLKSTSDLKFAA